MIKVYCDGCKKEIDIEHYGFSQWDGYQICDECRLGENSNEILKQIVSIPGQVWACIDFREEVKDEWL